MGLSYLPPDARAVCDWVRLQLGIDYEYRWEQLERRLVSHYPEVGCRDLTDYRRFLEKLEHRQDECKILAAIISNNDTSFFREPSHFAALAGPVIDDLRASGSAPRRLRFWSAACSSGEEAYSIALALLGSGKLTADEFEVVGSDISETALQLARDGLYRVEALRNVPQPLLEAYFQPCGAFVQANDTLKSCVRFTSVNLLDEERVFSLNAFDMIFLRNVMHYFSRTTQQAVKLTIAEVLRPGGYLALGHADALSDAQEYFDTVSLCGGELFVRKSDVTVTR
jgi:chemotaxis protein methyltransferase CheR